MREFGEPTKFALSFKILALSFAFSTSAVAQECVRNQDGFAGQPITVVLTYDNPMARPAAPDPLASTDDFFSDGLSASNGAALSCRKEGLVGQMNCVEETISGKPVAQAGASADGQETSDTQASQPTAAGANENPRPTAQVPVTLTPYLVPGNPAKIAFRSSAGQPQFGQSLDSAIKSDLKADLQDLQNRIQGWSMELPQGQSGTNSGVSFNTVLSEDFLSGDHYKGPSIGSAAFSPACMAAFRMQQINDAFEAKRAEFANSLIRMKERRDAFNARLTRAERRRDQAKAALKAFEKEVEKGGLTESILRGLMGNDEHETLKRNLADAEREVAETKANIADQNKLIEKRQREFAEAKRAAQNDLTHAHPAAAAAEQDRRVRKAIEARRDVELYAQKIKQGEAAYRDQERKIDGLIAQAKKDGNTAYASQLEEDKKRLSQTRDSWRERMEAIRANRKQELARVYKENQRDRFGPTGDDSLENEIAARGGNARDVLTGGLDEAGQRARRQAQYDANTLGGATTEQVTVTDVAAEIKSDFDNLSGKEFRRRYSLYGKGALKGTETAIKDGLKIAKEAGDTLGEGAEWWVNQGMEAAGSSHRFRVFGDENADFLEKGRRIIAETDSEKALAGLNRLADVADRRVSMLAGKGKAGTDKMIEGAGYVGGQLLGDKGLAKGAQTGMTVAKKGRQAVNTTAVLGADAAKTALNARRAQRAERAAAAAARSDTLPAKAAKADNFAPPSPKFHKTPDVNTSGSNPLSPDPVKAPDIPDGRAEQAAKAGANTGKPALGPNQQLYRASQRQKARDAARQAEQAAAGKDAPVQVDPAKPANGTASQVAHADGPQVPAAESAAVPPKATFRKTPGGGRVGPNSELYKRTQRAKAREAARAAERAADSGAKRADVPAASATSKPSSGAAQRVDRTDGSQATAKPQLASPRPPAPQAARPASAANKAPGSDANQTMRPDFRDAPTSMTEAPRVPSASKPASPRPPTPQAARPASAAHKAPGSGANEPMRPDFRDAPTSMTEAPRVPSASKPASPRPPTPQAARPASAAHKAPGSGANQPIRPDFRDAPTSMTEAPRVPSASKPASPTPSSKKLTDAPFAKGSGGAAPVPAKRAVPDGKQIARAPVAETPSGRLPAAPRRDLDTPDAPQSKRVANVDDAFGTAPPPANAIPNGAGGFGASPASGNGFGMNPGGAGAAPVAQPRVALKKPVYGPPEIVPNPARKLPSKDAPFGENIAPDFSKQPVGGELHSNGSNRLEGAVIKKTDKSEIEFGKNLGHGTFSSVYVSAGNKKRIVKVTEIRTEMGRTGAKDDAVGRALLENAQEKKGYFRVTVQHEQFVAQTDSMGGRSLVSVEENIATELPNGSTISNARQRFANRPPNRLENLTMQLAIRELNRKGIVWTDHKRANFDIIEGDSPTGYKMVIFDTGGMIPIKGSGPRRALAARHAQQTYDTSAKVKGGLPKQMQALYGLKEKSKLASHYDMRPGGYNDIDTVPIPATIGGNSKRPNEFKRLTQLSPAEFEAEIAIAQRELGLGDLMGPLSLDLP